jgi:hypothetical protein
MEKMNQSPIEIIIFGRFALVGAIRRIAPPPALLLVQPEQVGEGRPKACGPGRVTSVSAE